jgi:hypothetical protein
MPFKSEKQRRFLWSQHPDIAKRWAKEYPGQKDLPLYAHDKEPADKEKAAAMEELNKSFSVNTVGLRIYNECVKKANSGLLKVEIPHSDKPVAAGDEHVTAENQGGDNASPVQTRNEDEVNQSREELAGETVNSGVNPLLKKLAVVLSQPIMQAIENEKAEQQARMAAKMPQNVGVKRYAMPANTTPMPMGMQQPAQPAQPQQAQAAQPAQAQGAGMNSPSANPINSFGALSASGNINGNAAFGTKNSPDSSKSAASSPAWQRSAGKNDEGGLNEKGRKSYEREHGGNLKAPVTESNPSGDRAKRQNSFCSRMCGMKSVNTGAATAKDPDSRINKSLRKWNCKCSAMELAKQADLEVMKGGLGSRALASTAGHLGAFPGATIISLRSHVNPTQWKGQNGSYLTSRISDDDTRAQNLKQLAQDMERADPEALKDHRVYLGGGDFFREIPRIFTNPRTSLAGKAMGLAQHIPTQLYAAGMRGSLFNPATNSTYLMGDKPSVLTHELGHAIDFNSGKIPQYSDKEHPVKTWFKRQGKGLMHDAYGAGRMVPVAGMFHALYQEAQANRLSEQNLRRAYKDDPKALNKILDDRQKVLPAGYASYVGAAAAPFAGPFAPLLPLQALIAGKRFGMLESRRLGGKYVSEHKKEEHAHEDDAPATLKMPERSEKKDDEKEDKKEEHRKAAAAQLYKAAAKELYTPSDDVMTAAIKNFRTTNPTQPDGTPWDQNNYDFAAGMARHLMSGGEDIGNSKTYPAMPYAVDATYRAGQEAGDRQLRTDFDNLKHESRLSHIEATQRQTDMADQLTKSRKWLTNPRFWAGAGVGAAGLAAAYGLKKLYDRHRASRKKTEQTEAVFSADSPKTALYKSARPLGLDNYSSFAGPDQIQHAVQQYGQLKALVRPDDNTLRARGLNRDGFQSALRHIVRNSQGKDNYNLSDMAPDPKMYAAGAGALGLLGTAGLGYLGGKDGVGVGMAGTGAGMAAAYMHAANKRQNILNTAKLMKEYGLLKPKTLSHAYPLLADDHKFANAEEFVSKAAELAVARKS